MIFPIFLGTYGSAAALGVYAISISIYTAPKLGFLTFSGLVIFGQILTSDDF